MLHDDQRAQLDFADWLALHRQDEREERIRLMAKEYIERMPGGFNVESHSRFNIMQFPSSTAGYVARDATKPSVHVQAIRLEVHPGITGFARQIIAENIIREQLDLQDEPGYD